jgi:uncharacterized protein (DUF302 family)
MSQYSFGRTVDVSFDDAVKRVTEALAKEGFGVLTEIDVAATLKKKLDKDMPPYRILGACNPQFAHRVLEMEPRVGTLLPCNVVVRVDAAGHTIVEAMDPDVMSQLVGGDEVKKIASEVRSRIKRAVDSV